MTEFAGDPNFPENREYWEAVAQERLLIKRCVSCEKPHYYPRAYCPFCGGETQWEESKGKGEIYSYTVVRVGAEPYCPAYVTLDEGPTMIAVMVECDFDRLAVGDRVRVVFRRSARDGRMLPMFTPSAD
ncbi:OB-fold domain-containing protein [Sphingobium phenoxybenzoativorans]|uniref:OB-fold domain-containing protein n=1 Tax=Sphingobium phenoxybenzoativorans TaxID=1592790 RepID=A0A975K7G4_9SPHN|nr:OB-fold domain-containing protein [Sphingobium phenoxybenzoativorans]QUT05794.1 OB-fold domain-containing protein [Sphingobium phenoxybenzoativorans]